ncbi:hypothetical protein FHW67_000090 [Herbaspirillum sp. Sphag1AN]|nr:hypothetical protein [Herbaspirillum sp. Sphag1AN]MBB3244485.1 hypothetical protein [Herbaspirillum sp. Sphag64]
MAAVRRHIADRKGGAANPVFCVTGIVKLDQFFHQRF